MCFVGNEYGNHNQAYRNRKYCVEEIHNQMIAISIAALGTTKNHRASNLRKLYDNMKVMLGKNYHRGGSESYNPEIDIF